MAYELQDFQKDILEPSDSTPVILDFWAEWCGPCRQLGPVIEKLAGEAGERWKLVKIDTEENPNIAAQFGIRGIPAVKMVYQRQIIAEFTGAQPEHMIRQWLKENLPENGADDSEELLSQVEQLLAVGDRGKAKTVLEKRVDEEAGDEIKVRYAMLLLPDSPEKARMWLDQVDKREKYEIEFNTLETVDHLRNIANGDEEPANENADVSARYSEGISALLDKDFDTALSKFIWCVQADRSFDDDGARKACIACFTILGDRHPLTTRHRRRFSMALY